VLLSAGDNLGCRVPASGDGAAGFYLSRLMNSAPRTVLFRLIQKRRVRHAGRIALGVSALDVPRRELGRARAGDLAGLLAPPLLSGLDFPILPLAAFARPASSK